MINPQDTLADALDRLADECVKAIRVNYQLINQLSRAELLSSLTAIALTARNDQLEAQAAELQRRHPPDHRSPVR